MLLPLDELDSETRRDLDRYMHEMHRYEGSRYSSAKRRKGTYWRVAPLLHWMRAQFAEAVELDMPETAQRIKDRVMGVDNTFRSREEWATRTAEFAAREYGGDSLQWLDETREYAETIESTGALLGAMCALPCVQHFPGADPALTERLYTGCESLFADVCAAVHSNERFALGLARARFHEGNILDGITVRLGSGELVPSPSLLGIKNKITAVAEQIVAPAAQMQLLVRTINGGKTVTVDNVCGSDPIASVLDKVCAKTGVPHEQQRLVWAQHELDVHQTVGSYGLEPGCELQQLMRLRGGGAKSAAIKILAGTLGGALASAGLDEGWYLDHLQRRIRNDQWRKRHGQEKKGLEFGSEGVSASLRSLSLRSDPQAASAASAAPGLSNVAAKKRQQSSGADKPKKKRPQPKVAKWLDGKYRCGYCQEFCTFKGWAKYTTGALQDHWNDPTSGSEKCNHASHHVSPHEAGWNEDKVQCKYPPDRQKQFPFQPVKPLPAPPPEPPA